MQLNGIAHIYLTVSDFDACLSFYEKLLEFFEMQCLVKTDVLYCCAGGRTGLGIRRAAARHQDTPFDPYRSGLDHLCFRARSREDMDRVHDFVTGLGARIIHPLREDDWAPGSDGIQQLPAPLPRRGPESSGTGTRAYGPHGDLGPGAPPQACAGMAHSRQNLSHGVRSRTNELCFCGLLL